MTVAIIPIGGLGIRMNNDIPKQFIKINNKLICMYTIEKFQKNSNVDMIVLACVDTYQELIESECKKNNITKLKGIVKGGKTQLESIFNCYNYIKDEIHDDTKIIVHVGNRPLLSHNLIDKCINEYDKIGMLTTIIPSVEVMYNLKNNEIEDRNNIVRIQTPQVYSKDDLENLLKKCDLNDLKKYATVFDLMLHYGFNVKHIDGEILNFKITYPEDLLIFESIINNDKN